MRFRLALLFAFTLPSFALAHAMRLTVEITTAELRVLVKYEGADHGGGGPVVRLHALPGKELLAKKETDKTGVAVFARPANGQYLVVAEDEFHDAEVTLTVGNEEKTITTEPENKWLMLVLGLVAILALTGLGWYFSRGKKPTQ